jgi:hypothetical protein
MIWKQAMLQDVAMIQVKLKGATHSCQAKVEVL